MFWWELDFSDLNAISPVPCIFKSYALPHMEDSQSYLHKLPLWTSTHTTYSSDFSTLEILPPFTQTLPKALVQAFAIQFSTIIQLLPENDWWLSSSRTTFYTQSFLAVSPRILFAKPAILNNSANQRFHNSSPILARCLTLRISIKTFRLLINVLCSRP